MDNGSSPRLDRIEKIIETMVRAQRDRDEAKAKAQRERDIKSEKRHDRENRRIDAMVSRFVKFSVKDDRKHQKRMQVLDKKITQLAAAQLITEEKLQRFLSWRGTNGNGRRTK